MAKRVTEISSGLQVDTTRYDWYQPCRAIVRKEDPNQDAVFESTDEEEERSGTTDQQARDQDADRKQRAAESANKRAADSDVSEGYKMLLMKQKQKRLSATYDPEPYSVVSKRGDLVIIERGETLLKRNVGHVKRFIDPEPGAS